VIGKQKKTDISLAM